MKSKKSLAIFALFAVVFALSAVLADVDVEINDVEVNGVSVLCGDVVAGFASESIPVSVQFTANEDLEDVRVKVYIEGYKDEVYEGTSRFRVISGSTYVKKFSLTLPSTMDLDDTDEELSLLVRITAKGKDSFESSYAIRMQKDLYSLNLLSIDASNKALAGENLPVDIVLQNNGYERLDNVYVRASIPELGVSKTIYFGDIKPTEDEDQEDIPDAVNKKVYLTIPTNAAAGTYDIVVEAYNYDTIATAKAKIAINAVESGILSATSAKTVSPGEETTFDVVLINPNNRMVVYSIAPESAKGLIVDVTEPIVTVSSDSSKTVKVRVKASESAEEGTHLVTLNVVSENGVNKQVSFTLNVEGKASKTSTTAQPVLILTVVLSIVFVVLLIVLIVLLTKQPAQAEEFGETSYY